MAAAAEKSKTASKKSASTGSKAAAAKPARPAPRAKKQPAIKSVPAAELINNEKLMKRGDLLDKVAERSALSRGDLRVTMDLILDEIGKALDDDNDMALAPLGKLRVVRKRDVDNGNVLTVKLRRKVPESDTAIEAAE